jgi:hypothetical protein
VRSGYDIFQNLEKESCSGERILGATNYKWAANYIPYVISPCFAPDAVPCPTSHLHSGKHAHLVIPNSILNQMLLQLKKSQAPSPQIADGISIRKPRTSSAFPSHVVIENLPWIQCLNFLELQGMDIFLGRLLTNMKFSYFDLALLLAGLFRRDQQILGNHELHVNSQSSQTIP